jgi:hypothetical protein
MTGELAMKTTTTKLHIAIESQSQEIYYMSYGLVDSVWSTPHMISRNDSACSFNPQAITWGDSDVAFFWIDYEYSPYPWTGDIIMRRSTDNGETWLPEQQVTFNHLAMLEDKQNICERNDSLFLVYDEIVLDGETNTEEIFFNLSSDGGATWGEPERLTFAPWRSLYPSLTVMDNYVHVAWCDARNDSINGNHNNLYYKRGIISPDQIIRDRDGKFPERMSLGVYPNPFNSSVLLSYHFHDREGGELRIVESILPEHRRNIIHLLLN